LLLGELETTMDQAPGTLFPPAPHGEEPTALGSLRRALPALLPTLRARALRLSRDGATAEDLVQDTLERALRFASTFEPDTNLRAWMHKILLSVFVSRCRRLSRERRALDWLANDPCAWTNSDGPAEQPALLPSVEGAIARLPPQFACVIRLVDLGEHSYKDAALCLGVPVGTVMSRLFRGRQLLAAALGPEPALVACAA
jgi:RNA polymerase sigma-70 factor (ECF subfamily)